jgi:hypothetical protein
MSNAVADWFVSEHANTLDSNGEKMSSRAYAMSVGIPLYTLEKYIHKDQTKRRELGKQVGAKPAPALPPASTQKPPPAAKKAPEKVKQTRTNWSQGVHLEKMSNAVADWFVSEHANTLDSNGEKMSSRAYAMSVGIPLYTLEKYIHKDQTKRRELGKQVGAKPVFEKNLSQFVSDVVRGNEGMSRRETIDLIREVKPELSFHQARNYFDRTFKMHHTDEIKSKPVKTQKTDWQAARLVELANEVIVLKEFKERTEKAAAEMFKLRGS